MNPLFCQSKSRSPSPPFLSNLIYYPLSPLLTVPQPYWPPCSCSKGHLCSCLSAFTLAVLLPRTLLLRCQLVHSLSLLRVLARGQVLNVVCLITLFRIATPSPAVPTYPFGCSLFFCSSFHLLTYYTVDFLLLSDQCLSP